ncbi:MAG: hypothetical protein NVSMB4_06210 [Acidimicrobiales bacterium]
MARKKNSKKIGDAIDIPDQGSIKPADIKAKLAEIDGSFQQTTKAAAPIGLAVGAGAVVVLVLVVFALGKRRGRKRSTVVEIRRI